MIPSYLINLDRSEDRLAHMRKEFGRVGVEFERIAGIDGSSIDAGALDEFRRARTAAKSEGWLPGEVGCFLSHFEAWRRIASKDDAWAAVFEDDIRVASDFGGLLRSADWIPADADIVRLEANRPMRLAARRAIAGSPGQFIYRALSGSAGSAGYIIARDAATRLLASPVETHTSVDVFLFKPKMSDMARSLSRYQVVPALCVQDGVLERGSVELKSLIKARNTRGRAYRERSNPILRLWPISRHAVPFQP